MLDMVKTEILDLKNSRDLQEVREFLACLGLAYESDLELTVVLRLNGVIIGTGSCQGDILRNIGIADNFQGLGLTAAIVTRLMQEQARRGILHHFIFTKPDKAHLFSGLGFNEIARAEPYVVLLESGLGSVASFCESVNKEASQLKPKRAAVVANCNPFTKGHRALIERAARDNEAIIVFIVSEDRSLFPFQDRIRLVREGTRDLPNVLVVPSGKYIISDATFPTYFIRDEDKDVAQTRLDVTLFAAEIAPRLGITARYAGEEPYCPVTKAYNQAMLDILPKYGLAVKVMERIEANGEIVSASKVREAIKKNDWETIQRLVPVNTYQYLKHPSTQVIIEKIQQSSTRH